MTTQENALPSQIYPLHSEQNKALRRHQTPSLTKNPLDFFREIGGHVIESDHGWVNYYIHPGDNCYLENMYIYPGSRQGQNGTYLLSCLEMKAKEIHGCKWLFTTISRAIPDPDKNLQMCLKRGFKFHSSTNDAIILKKEL